MKSVLKWYMVVGGIVLAVLLLLDFTTPAISEDALILNIVWAYFSKLFSVESFMIAAIGCQLLSSVKADGRASKNI